MPWLPIDTHAAHQTPPHAMRGDLACNPDNAPTFYVDLGGRGGHASYERARLICGRCPAIAECLDWALDTHQRYGMWGGVTPQERIAMLRDPRLRTAAARYAQTLALALSRPE